MRVFLYEWVTGGGLVGTPGPLLPSFLREGRVMAQAVAGDLAAVSGVSVTLLREPRVESLCAPGCEVVDVDSPAARDDALACLFDLADAVLLVAPELDGALLSVAREAKESNARLVSPEVEVIEIASDKERTAKKLSAAGVPTPKGRILQPEEALPSDFAYPAVLKPLDGAGSEGIYVVAGAGDIPPSYAWPRRLERFIPGLAVSVALLTGPSGATALPPCQQRLSTDGRLRYEGGVTPLAAGLALRAQRLASQAIAAFPESRGYVGVDLVLGSDPDGSEDYVIEVNPRLTTSYVGLRAIAERNLAHAMLAVVRGERVELTFREEAIEFTVDGTVSYVRQ